MGRLEERLQGAAAYLSIAIRKKIAPADDEYAKQVARGLTRAFADRSTCLGTEPMDFDPGHDALVCVSDLHRGKRDGADDHRRTERMYNAALAWYLGSGYRLAILGDAEDLWEGSPEEVLGMPSTVSERGRAGYLRSLELESAFNDQGRYLRLWGNHDALWSDADSVERWLQPYFSRPVRVHGAATVPVGGRIGEQLRASTGGEPVFFLTHGHQGTPDSDVFGPESARFVRAWAWLQARVGAWTAMPSDDWALRDEHSVAMYDWAVNDPRRPVLIAGHTHAPVFGPRVAAAPPAKSRWDELEAELQALWPPSGAAGAERAAALEFALGELRRQQGLQIGTREARPCFFDTGACCYGDGELTTLEIGDGEIRLVRWSWREDANELIRETRDHESLLSVFGDVLGETPQPSPLPAPFDLTPPRLVEWPDAKLPAAVS